METRTGITIVRRNQVGPRMWDSIWIQGYDKRQIAGTEPKSLSRAHQREISGDTRTRRSEHSSRVRPKDQLQSITAQSSTNLISIANTVYLPYNFCTSRRRPAKSIIRDRGVLAFAVQTNKETRTWSYSLLYFGWFGNLLRHVRCR